MSRKRKRISRNETRTAVEEGVSTTSTDVGPGSVLNAGSNLSIGNTREGEFNDHHTKRWRLGGERRGPLKGEDIGGAENLLIW